MPVKTRIAKNTTEKPTGLCDAHGIFYDTVIHLRENQAQIYDLIRVEADKTAQTVIGLATLSESTKEGFDALNASMLRLEKLMMRKKWSPGKIVALVTALVGPSGLIVFFSLVDKIPK